MKPIFAALCLVSLTQMLAAQTSYPMISYTHPVIIERGKTTEVTVEGTQNFHGAYSALFEGAGVKAEIVADKTPAATPAQRPTIKTVKLKVTVSEDAMPGVREFRIATPLGVSSIGQLVVSDSPVLVETAPNNTLAQAPKITLPGAVAGKLEVAEDVDYFQFEGKEGQSVTFELQCARLQDKIHDLQKHAKPMLSLFDAEGRELAANDHFFFADPMLSFVLPKTGTYFIQVRESTYDGDPRWVYALMATQKPYVSHLYPMAANPGKEATFEPVGSAKRYAPQVKLMTPEKPGVYAVQVEAAGNLTNPTTLIVSPLRMVMEQEPNDDPAQATRFTVPAGINGRIGKKRDMDHFVFAGQKGRAVRLELKARRFGSLLNSSLHGVLEVLNPKGALVASNDDSHGKEAALVFTPTADGDYLIRIRDLNSKGGDSFVYFLEADWSLPDFTARCDPDKAMIGPGSATAWYVHVVRTGGFAGPVDIEVNGLPDEVKASKLTIPPTMTQGVIVLTASQAATQTVAPIELIARGSFKNADGKDETLVRAVQPNQEIYFPGGGRGKFDVNSMAVCVTEPSDILDVKVNQTEIILKPGQEVKIDVDVIRRADYDKGLSLDIPLSHLGTVFGNPLPPGVTIVPGKSKTLLGAGSKGFITIKADPVKSDPVERVPISVLAHVSINFVVKVSYSSPVIWVSVRK